MRNLYFIPKTPGTAPQPEADNLKRYRNSLGNRRRWLARHYPGWPHHVLQCSIVDHFEMNYTHLAGLLIAQTGPEKMPGKDVTLPDGRVSRVYSPIASMLYAEGMKPGVPALFLLVARGGWHGLFIGLIPAKAQPDSTSTSFCEATDFQGYATGFVSSLPDAVNLLTQYLALSEPLPIILRP